LLCFFVVQQNQAGRPANIAGRVRSGNLGSSWKAGRKLIVRHAGIAAGWPRIRRQAAIRQVAGD
jgi:hypothetical protein